jgi:hypothetical protein
MAMLKSMTSVSRFMAPYLLQFNLWKKNISGLWIRIPIRIGSEFNDVVDLDWESGSRIQIQGQENEEKYLRYILDNFL